MLNGEDGVGKSFLANEVGYFIHSRHAFNDGVYFIEIKNLRMNQDFSSFLQGYFGKDLKPNNLHMFFQENKEMLVIFDDVHLLNTDQHIRQVREIFTIFQLYKI